MMNIENRIQGKVIAITGASSGIGEATAIMLAAHGAKVVLGARRSDRLEELNNRIKASGGGFHLSGYRCQKKGRCR